MKFILTTRAHEALSPQHYLALIDVAWIQMTENPKHAKRYNTMHEAMRAQETAEKFHNQPLFVRAI